MARPAGASFLAATASATIGVALGMKSLWNIGNILKCISIIIYSLPPEERNELVSCDESGNETFKLSPMDTGRTIAGFIQSSLCSIPPSKVSSLPPDVRQRQNQNNLLHDAAYFHLRERLGHLDRSGGLLPGLLFNISTPGGVKKALHLLTSSLQGLCSLWLITPDAAGRLGNPTDVSAITNAIKPYLQSRQFYFDSHRLLQNLAYKMFGDSVDLSTLGGVNDVLRRIDSALRALLSLNDLVPGNDFSRSDHPQGLADAVRDSVRSTATSATATAQEEIFTHLRALLSTFPNFNIVSYDQSNTIHGKMAIIAQYVSSLANCSRHYAEQEIFGQVRSHFLSLPGFDINGFDRSDGGEKIIMISQYIAKLLAQRQRPFHHAERDAFGPIRTQLVRIVGFDINRFDRSDDRKKIAMIASALAQLYQRPTQTAEQDIFGPIRSQIANVAGFDIRKFDRSDNAAKLAMISLLITSMRGDVAKWCHQVQQAEIFCHEQTCRANRAEARAADAEMKWNAHVASRQEQPAESPKTKLRLGHISQLLLGGALIGAFATALLVMGSLWAPIPSAVIIAILGGFWLLLPESWFCALNSEASIRLLEEFALYLGQQCLGHSHGDEFPPPPVEPQPGHPDVPGSPLTAGVESPLQHEQERPNSHVDEAELEEEVEVEEPPVHEEPSLSDPQPEQSSLNLADPNSHDLYHRLGATVSASPGDIKKAYRVASLRFHPDKIPDKNNSAAIEKAKLDMIRINQAKEILLDVELKQRYDAGALQAGLDYDVE